MQITKRRDDTSAQVLARKNRGAVIGFVPTMGALHQGHLSLIEKACQTCDMVVASIFVNPIQFNNPSDLEHYPRTITADLEKLEAAGCDLVFTPDAQEMYPQAITEQYDFGKLEQVLEGEHRPGHFNGVAVVVKRLFDIITPHKAFFGEKDYQQLLIINALVKQTACPVEIVPCPIIREADGLAMSSRNLLLTPEERKIAPFLYQTLCEAAEKGKEESIETIVQWGEMQFQAHPSFRLEYFQIADSVALQPLHTKEGDKAARILVAAWLGNVRLIDNVQIIF
ncbi:MAG: pantoate--beta-alanine ligase [Bacteroidetes bacterium]|nr:MAG: pantoate--beta-alanine ligase [Bacteroidota bacterium]